ncbi:NAD-dependent epimerase/dehydratase family protein [Candidatus Omnitrophota bacterium]
MTKLLITGHAGDVGSVLFKMFQEAGEDVASLTIENNTSAQRILHLAAKSPPATEHEMRRSNEAFLKEVIAYAEKNKIKEFIFFSAASVYGDIDKEDVYEEGVVATPSFYGSLKLLGEELLKKSSLNVLCLRLPAILSFTNTTNFLSRCFIKLYKNEVLEITNADRLFNNFVSIESIFDFLHRIELNRPFDVINLASKKEKTLRQVVEIIKNELQSKSELIFSDKRNSFFNLSTQKAEKEYGFVPEAVEKSFKRWVAQRIKYEKVKVS